MFILLVSLFPGGLITFFFFFLKKPCMPLFPEVSQ